MFTFGFVSLTEWLFRSSPSLSCSLIPSPTDNFLILRYISSRIAPISTCFKIWYNSTRYVCYRGGTIQLPIILGDQILCPKLRPPNARFSPPSFCNIVWRQAWHVAACWSKTKKYNGKPLEVLFCEVLILVLRLLALVSLLFDLKSLLLLKSPLPISPSIRLRVRLCVVGPSGAWQTAELDRWTGRGTQISNVTWHEFRLVMNTP